MDAELKATLDRLQASVDRLQESHDQTDRTLRAIKTQLNVLEYGVLAIAQKLLAAEEVDELKTGMAGRRRAAVA